MDNIITTLQNSPRLFLYYQQIESILKEEQNKRKYFYNSVNDDCKAEFINGKIILHSPVKLKHDKTGSLLLKLLHTYVNVHDLGYVGHEKMMISLTRNDYEPDICFWNKKISAEFKPDQTRFPPPDFIAEILSSSTKEIDRGIKFDDYAAHGVSEYWIIDSTSQTIEQYVLKDYLYALLKKIQGKEIMTSVAVKNFTLPAMAVFYEKENRKILKKILN